MSDGRLLALGAASALLALSLGARGSLLRRVAPERKGSPARRRKPATPDARRDEAASVYGTTDDPFSTGFILADGRWLDFSGGAGMGRTQDHRHVGHLLADDEHEPQHAYAASTKDMNRWMNLAQAVRVSVHMLSGSHFPSRRRGASYALLDLPEDKGAIEAVLRMTGRRAILRFLRDAGAAEVSVNFTRDGREQRLEVEGAPWAVEAALDQALGIADDEGSENRRGSRLRRVAPAPRKDPEEELRRARKALEALSSTDDFKRLKEALEQRVRHLRKAVFDASMEIHEPLIDVQIAIWLGDLKEVVPERSPGVAVRLRVKIRRLLHRTHDADLLTRLKSLHDEVAEAEGWFVRGERVLDEMEQAIRALGANDGSENRHPGSGPARGSRLAARGSQLRRVAPEPVGMRTIADELRREEG